MRIGQGFDAHRFDETRRLVLGGVEIDHPLGLLGHSDADVLLHAIIDALLGAAGLGDIGMRFPDTNPDYRGISSLLLLADVVREIGLLGYSIANVDATIMAQKPKIGPYRDKMTQSVSQCLGIDVSRVNIKATTTEKMGFVGREEGIAASAVVLLEEKL